MLDAVPRHERAWSLVGKIGVVIGTLLGAVSLYRAARPDAPRLTAQCQILQFDSSLLYSDIKRRLDELHEQARNATAIGVLPQDPQSALAAASTTLGKSVNALELNNLANELDSDRTVALCAISNVGSRDAKGATVDFPFHVIGAKLADDMVQQSAITDKRVAIGDFRPGERRELVAWTSDMVLLLDEGQIQMTYADGRGNVQMARTLYGSSAAIAAAMQKLVVQPVFWILLVLQVAAISALIALWSQRFRRHAQSEAPQSDQTGDNGAA